MVGDRQAGAVRDGSWRKPTSRNRNVDASGCRATPMSACARRPPKRGWRQRAEPASDFDVIRARPVLAQRASQAGARAAERPRGRACRRRRDRRAHSTASFPRGPMIRMAVRVTMASAATPTQDVDRRRNLDRKDLRSGVIRHLCQRSSSSVVQRLAICRVRFQSPVLRQGYPLPSQGRARHQHRWQGLPLVVCCRSSSCFDLTGSWCSFTRLREPFPMLFAGE